MGKKELEKIIKQLESSNAKEEVYFAICEYDDTERYFIKANKQGLELFARELLEGSMELDEVANERYTNTIPFEGEWLWTEGIRIDYIKLIGKEEIEGQSNELTFIDKLIPFGCTGAFLFVIVSAIVGAATIISWVF